MPPSPDRRPPPDADRNGRTPLWYHALSGDLAAVRAELSAGSDPSFGDNTNYSPLHVAVQGGWVEVIQLLIESGANPNKADHFGNNPLWTAILSAPKESKVEIINLLLGSGANPDHKNRVNKSPRDAAITIGCGLEIPFHGIATRVPDRAEEVAVVMDEQTEIPLDDDPKVIASWIWKNLVPASGQSAWVQGELLRCIEKFRWEAQNNGNGNWNSQFKMLADYLEKTLRGEPTFSEKVQHSIHKDMKTVRNYMAPYTEDDLYDRLTIHVVAFCRLHPSLIPKPPNSKLTR
jgi:hypothetical protein